MKKLVLFASLLTSMLPSFAYADIAFGVASNRGELATRQEWSDMTELLSKEMGTTVNLVPVPIERALQAFADKEVDYILANPLICATAEVKYNAKALATRDDGTGAQFGGVIIANKNSGISSIEDMVGKKLMTYTKDSAGAYLFQAYELHKHGVDVSTDFSKVVVAKKQDDIAMAVKAGMFDAGFVRTGILESMEKSGLLKIDDFIIVNKQEGDVPLVLSTSLYPSWAVIAQGDADEETTKKLTDFLMSVKGDNPAAEKAKVASFIPPRDLKPLAEVMTALRVPPFDQ